MSDESPTKVEPTKVTLGAYAVHNCRRCDLVHLQAGSKFEALRMFDEAGRRVHLVPLNQLGMAIMPMLELQLSVEEARALAAALIATADGVDERPAAAKSLAEDLVKGAQEP